MQNLLYSRLTASYWLLDQWMDSLRFGTIRTVDFAKTLDIRLKII